MQVTLDVSTLHTNYDNHHNSYIHLLLNNIYKSDMMYMMKLKFNKNVILNYINA